MTTALATWRRNAELRETCELVMRDARIDGHDPHPFLQGGDSLESRTACRVCGARFFVRVTAAQVTVERAEGECPRGAGL